MEEEILLKCRLCNYQSDKRLMMDVFEEATEYSKKIKNYLNVEVKFFLTLKINLENKKLISKD